MNNDQIRQTIRILDEIDRINIEEQLIKQFPNAEPDCILAQDFTRAQFVTLTRRVAGQLRAELSDDGGRFLPVIFSWEYNGFANRHLINTLQEFSSHVQSSSWDGAIALLHLLVGYQIYCGFWDRSSKRLHSLGKLKRQELASGALLQIEALKMATSEAKANGQTLGEAVGRIETHSSEIGSLLENARSQGQQMTELLTKGATESGKLEEIVKAQDNHKRVTEEFLLKIDARNVEFERAVKAADEQLTRTKEVWAWIKEKEALVNEIAGTAAAGLLGQKFEARRKELGTVCNWWLGGLAVALAVSAAWLWLTHKYFHIDGVMFWAQLASNFGLMLPALFLVLFVAAQYLKERNFQEEYAFRASVAMTLKAFADEMAGENTERNQVLRETIAKLYQMPNGLLAKNDENPASVSKAVTEFLKGTTELVKEVKK
jgi:hypothetical protein